MKIYEVWKPFKLILSMCIGFILMGFAVRWQSYPIGMMAVIFGWQGGWGVKLEKERERLEILEREYDEEKTTKVSQEN